MTRFAALGDLSNLRIKSFELGGHTFKVRVPLTKEMEEISDRIEKISSEEINERYQKMSSGFQNGEKIEGIEIKEDDVLVNGRSTKELAESAIKIERRVIEYFKLLVIDGDLDGLTYQEIEDSFPFSVQLEIITKISEAIQPGYKEQRKNS
jgi:predicted HAD superfamily hydrolase